MSLDSLVKRVCTALHDDVSPLVAKCIIQMARYELHHLDRVEIGPLASDVCLALRNEHIVVTPLVVQAVLMVYTSEVAALGVVQVVEGRY